MDCNFNLFGEPVPANHGCVGKPAHAPTDENRNKIIVLLAVGWTNARIANVLGVSQPTMRQYYSSELSLRKKAMDRVKATRFAMLFAEMQKGNITAHKEFDRLLQREYLDMGAAKMNRPAKDQPDGKKASKKAQAPDAHRNTSWEDVVPDAGSLN